MANDIRERVKRIAKSQRQWADATGQNYEHVSRIMTGRYDVPDWWEPMVELLEALPPKDWPERWTK